MRGYDGVEVNSPCTDCQIRTTRVSELAQDVSCLVDMLAADGVEVLFI